MSRRHLPGQPSGPRQAKQLPNERGPLQQQRRRTGATLYLKDMGKTCTSETAGYKLHAGPA